MQALIFIEANGKAEAWSRIAKSLGMTVKVVATTGHVCSFPETLFPIGIDLSSGATLEKRRRPDSSKEKRILSAVAGSPKAAAIILAMDDDVEGDVIAFDLADMIYRAHPERRDRIVRVRPGPITARGIRASLASATPIMKCLSQMATDAIPGRARAVSDRWIGATFSRIAGVPVGRVRSAILGATWLNNKAPGRLRGRPETGEITFQARSSFGGRPFIARIGLDGSQDRQQVEILLRVARKWSGTMVPGIVRPLQPAGAAIAPRVGTVRPFNTGDALAYASRHHAIPVKMAMQGLQDAYLHGLISYPRTDSREMSRESASRVTMLGFGCGLEGLDTEVLSSEGRLSSIDIPGAPAGAHEALHPVISITTKNTHDLRSLVRRPLREPLDGWDRASVMEAMSVIVARRAFEASREIMLERGNWSPDNGPNVDEMEIEVLRDLDWVREDGFRFPWSRGFLTSVKEWPAESVILETMIGEGIGRPSTYAGHVDTAMRSGDIESGVFPDPPRPSPQGMNTLRRTPKSVWNPAVCRIIEDAMENAGNAFGEDTSAPLPDRARHRVLSWLRMVPSEMRTPLLEALKENDGNRGLAGLIRSKPSVSADAAGSVLHAPAEPAEPSPAS